MFIFWVCGPARQTRAGKSLTDHGDRLGREAKHDNIDVVYAHRNTLSNSKFPDDSVSVLYLSIGARHRSR